MKELVYILQAPPFWLKTPPLSLEFLKNHLRTKGINVGLLDLNMLVYKVSRKTMSEWLPLNAAFENNLFSWLEKKYPEILERVYRQIQPARYIGFSVLKRNASFAFSLAEAIRRRFPKKNLIFGGPHILALNGHNDFKGPDSWVIGEGEIPLAEIVQTGQKRIYKFIELQDLDLLPFCDFACFHLGDYSKTLPLLASRGCPHQCRFCAERLLYKTFRCHSPRYIIEQIKCLKTKYQTENFVFLDSLINFNREWLYRFCSGLIKNSLKINWEAQMRIESDFPPELARLMKKSGCYNLFLGLESGSDKVLEMMNKGFTAGVALEFFHTLKASGLHFEISLIFGYPGETEQDFRKTLDFLTANKKLLPKIAQANPYIDYLNNSGQNYSGSMPAKMRLRTFLKTIKTQKIKYTKSFINNLAYHEN
jgi:radical SAM superfamily enzyme YgiQ (UPF0313 family)